MQNYDDDRREMMRRSDDNNDDRHEMIVRNIHIVTILMTYFDISP